MGFNSTIISKKYRTEKKQFLDGEVGRLVNVKLQIPINKSRHSLPKIYYYYYIENPGKEVIEENSLREKHNVRCLALEKFNVKNEKSKTDSVINIELIDNVILFGDSNTYGILAEKKKLSIFHKHLIETYLSDLNMFRLSSQMETNFKCFKKFCNLKNSLLSKENEYRNECSSAFEEVYLFRHSSCIEAVPSY